MINEFIKKMNDYPSEITFKWFSMKKFATDHGKLSFSSTGTNEKDSYMDLFR